MQMAIVSRFQRQTTQTTQARMTMMTTTKPTLSQGTVSAVSSNQDSDIIVFGGGTLHSLNQQAQRRRQQAFDYDSFMGNLLLELKKKNK